MESRKEFVAILETIEKALGPAYPQAGVDVSILCSALRVDPSSPTKGADLARQLKLMMD